MGVLSMSYNNCVSVREFSSKPLDIPDLRNPVGVRLRRNAYAHWLRILTLMVVDAALLSLAWVMAGIYGTEVNSFWDVGTNPLSLLIVITIEISLIGTQGLYKAGERRLDYLSLITTVTFAHILLLLIAFLVNSDVFISRSTYILSILFSASLVCVGRFGVDLLLKQLRKQGLIRYPTLVICPAEDRDKAISLLKREDCYGQIHTLDAHSVRKENIEGITEKIKSLGIAEVFVCYWRTIKEDERMFLYWNFRNAGITLRVLCIDVESCYQKSEISLIGGIPTINFFPPIITGFDFWAKRCFDFLVSGLLLVFLAPLLLYIACLIKQDSPGPIIYKQERVGLHGVRFKAWKFRSMFTNADELMRELEARNEMKDGVLFKIKDDPRITRVGKLLRRYSLDELPQLVNVLCGQMSLVGPRPLPTRDVSKFSEHHFIRQLVLPGITGLWQVSGRSDILSFEDVLSLDTFYMENWSLWLDLKILMRTAVVILQKKGAY